MFALFDRIGIPPVLAFPLGFIVILVGLATAIALVITLVDLIDRWITSFQQKRKDAAFYNTAYLCENEACHTSFFRMVHVFEAYKRRNMHIPGDTVVDEAAYSKHLTPELAEDMELVRCPTCHKCDVIQSKEYDWMKKEQDMAPLTIVSLYKRRRDFNNGQTERQTRKALDSIEKNINEIEEISAFQYRHRLTSEIDSSLHDHVINIREQLQRIQRETNYPSINQKAGALIARLNQTGTERFTAMRGTKPAPIYEAKDDKETRDALKNVFKQCHKNSERIFDKSGKKHVPDSVIAAIGSYTYTADRSRQQLTIYAKTARTSTS